MLLRMAERSQMTGAPEAAFSRWSARTELWKAPAQSKDIS